MAKRTVVLYPFFSQQNKGTGKFLFRSCGSTKILRFIGEQLLRDGIADSIRFVAPDRIEWGEDLEKILPEKWIHVADIPPNNEHQRLSWPAEDWDYIFDGADLVFNMNEMIGWPLKKLYPETKVVSMFTVAPTAEPWPWMEPLIHLSLQYSDLITVPSETMTSYVRNTVSTYVRGVSGRSQEDVVKWPLSFDQEELDRLLVLPPSGKPLVDVLFVFRASASNYTHHREFVEALRLLEYGMPLRVAFTDTTRYLRKNPEELEGLLRYNVEILDDPGDQEKYADLLRRSRVVVGMNDNMHGGMGVREAMYAGAVPILLDAPCYRELLGSEKIVWPVWIRNPVTACGIAAALKVALELTQEDSVSKIFRFFSQDRASLESFQSTWKVMKPEIKWLFEKGA